MDISPQRVRTAEFKTVKRGLDPDEVQLFLNEVAAELERAQNQSTAMEARARAAVARLQEISEATPAAPTAEEAAPVAEPAPEPVADFSPSVDQADTISRTLLLAQRTADTAIAEAEAEATRLRSEAEVEATQTIDSAREITERLAIEAREEARRHGEAARIQVESEVNALLARRDFLESDVDHLQTFLVDERSRLREAANEIMELVERVPSGLGEVRRPLLSASDDEEATPDPVHAAADAQMATSELPVIADERSIAEAAVAPASEVEAAADDAATADNEAEASAEPKAATGTFAWSGESAAPEDDADEPERLVIQTDISDEGPTGFSYDKN